MPEECGREQDEPKRLQHTDTKGAQAAPGFVVLSVDDSAPTGSLLGDARLNQRGNAPVKARVMRSAQRAYGNRAVQCFLDRVGPGRATHPLQRQAEAEEQGVPGLEGLGKREELPGHAQTGGRRGTGSSGHGTGSSGSTRGASSSSSGRSGRSSASRLGSVVANVTLTANEPAIEGRSAAEIARRHNQPGAVGWTTPRYDTRVRGVSANAIRVHTEMDFTIEVAQGLTDAESAVLLDHEEGHVRIGEREGRRHLVEGLRNDLQQFQSFSAAAGPGVQQAINVAGDNFSRAEGAASRAYDRRDYGRMTRAYRGSRQTIDQLGRGNPRVRNMITALRRFSLDAPTADEHSIIPLAQGIVTARGRLLTRNLERLQYNPDVERFVQSCREKAETFITGHPGLPATTVALLRNVQTILDGFTASPAG